MNVAYSSRIHPTAVIYEGAEIGLGVEIGPYSIIHSNVRIGDGCFIGSHVIVCEGTTMGAANQVYSGAVIGQTPQDLKYRGEETELLIGHGNTIREYVTISKGTAHGGGVTRVGDGNLIMSYSHIGHDCQVGNRVIISNSTNLAGHVVVDDHAVLGGMTGVHQFCRIGSYAMIGAVSMIKKDVAPYTLVQGDPARLYGLNTTGLKRGGFTADKLRQLKAAYSVLFRSGLPLTKALAELDALGSSEELDRIKRFVQQSQRGVVSRGEA